MLMNLFYGLAGAAWVILLLFLVFIFMTNTEKV